MGSRTPGHAGVESVGWIAKPHLSGEANTRR